ncbi:JAB domain-containing protein [Enterococcus sp. LJL90]
MTEKMKQVIKIEQKFIAEERSFYRVTTSLSLADFISKEIGNNASESLFVACVNTRNQIIAYTELFKGSINRSIAHPREVFMFGLLNNASHLVLGHNHPSQDTTPSEADKEMTTRMKTCGELMGIPILDHIIVSSTPTKYYSFREEGFFNQDYPF